MGEHALIPVESIAGTILTIRGQRVIIDADLARLYGVTTKQINQAVKRNVERFPADFMFTLTTPEKDELVTNCDRFVRLKHSSALPHAFTEHGALMAANVLNSLRAVEMSVLVVRAFVRQRELLASHTELALKLEQLERKLLASFALHEDRLDDQGSQLEQIFRTLRMLRDELATRQAAPSPSRKRIGFRPKAEDT